MADNVSAVNEAPELTARSAEGFPRPFMIDTLHDLPWQAAKRRRVTPSVLCAVGFAGRAAHATGQ
jgi:hypothetical protein